MKRISIYAGGREIIARYVGEKLVYAKVKKITLQLSKTTYSPFAKGIDLVEFVIPHEIRKILKVEIEGFPSYEGEMEPNQIVRTWSDNKWCLYGITFSKELTDIYNLNGGFMNTGNTVTIHYI
ncbi:hypothetical protein [Facklamia hominis]|uniref:hypothetical protein n=1 Tax=Facklamia hominis TaxID=178214 RepID=UPI00101C7DDE|nr:hypothetical protein [Facklamia hominis]RYC97859.1 hypothetical protein EKN08_05745 [Facklamia hominis]